MLSNTPLQNCVPTVVSPSSSHGWRASGVFEDGQNRFSCSGSGLDFTPPVIKSNNGERIYDGWVDPDWNDSIIEEKRRERRMANAAKSKLLFPFNYPGLKISWKTMTFLTTGEREISGFEHLCSKNIIYTVEYTVDVLEPIVLDVSVIGSIVDFQLSIVEKISDSTIDSASFIDSKPVLSLDAQLIFSSGSCVPYFSFSCSSSKRSKKKDLDDVVLAFFKSSSLKDLMYSPFLCIKSDSVIVREVDFRNLLCRLVFPLQCQKFFSSRNIDFSFKSYFILSSDSDVCIQSFPSFSPPSIEDDISLIRASSCFDDPTLNLGFSELPIYLPLTKICFKASAFWLKDFDLNFPYYLVREDPSIEFPSSFVVSCVVPAEIAQSEYTHSFHYLTSAKFLVERGDAPSVNYDYLSPGIVSMLRNGWKKGRTCGFSFAQRFPNFKGYSISSMEFCSWDEFLDQMNLITFDEFSVLSCYDVSFESDELYKEKRRFSYIDEDYTPSSSIYFIDLEAHEKIRDSLISNDLKANFVNGLLTPLWRDEIGVVISPPLLDDDLKFLRPTPNYWRFTFLQDSWFDKKTLDNFPFLHLKDEHIEWFDLKHSYKRLLEKFRPPFRLDLTAAILLFNLSLKNFDPLNETLFPFTLDVVLGSLTCLKRGILFLMDVQSVQFSDDVVFSHARYNFLHHCDKVGREIKASFYESEMKLNGADEEENDFCSNEDDVPWSIHSLPNEVSPQLAIVDEATVFHNDYSYGSDDDNPYALSPDEIEPPDWYVYNNN